MSQVIRVSDEVAAYLLARKGQKRGWDGVLRRILGLPPRKGAAQPILEAWVLPESGRAYATKAIARGEAIMNAAKTKGDIEKPILMREVI